MFSLADVVPGVSVGLPLVVGMVMLLAASFGVQRGTDGVVAPFRRALGHWMPIAAVAIAAIFFRRGEIALALIFSTSIASLTLVLGATLLGGPIQLMSEPRSRLWVFVLPSALIAFLIGFSGKISPFHAGLLLIEGVAILIAFWGSSVSSYPKLQGRSHPLPEKPKNRFLHGITVTFAILLAAIGANAVVVGLMHLGPMIQPLWQHMRIRLSFDQGAPVAVLIAPLLAMPMLFSAAKLTGRGKASAAVTMSVSVVLLNLCLLLPLAALLWYPASVSHRAAPHFVAGQMRQTAPMIFAFVSWRVDSVVLIILGFVLLALSLGRWKMDRAEGLVLIALYAVYALTEALASIHG